MTIAKAIDKPVDIPPAAGAVETQVDPFDVSTLPVVLGAIPVTADVPFPTNNELIVCVAAPVPPPATGNPVQLVSVPDVGVPNTGVTSTILVEVQAEITPDATVPNTGAVIVGAVKVLFVNTSDVALPIRVSVATGNVSTEVPDIAGADKVIVPLVSPATTMLLILSPF